MSNQLHVAGVDFFNLFRLTIFDQRRQDYAVHMDMIKQEHQGKN